MLANQTVASIVWDHRQDYVAGWASIGTTNRSDYNTADSDQAASGFAYATGNTKYEYGELSSNTTSSGHYSASGALTSFFHGDDAPPPSRESGSNSESGSYSAYEIVNDTSSGASGRYVWETGANAGGYTGHNCGRTIEPHTGGHQWVQYASNDSDPAVFGSRSWPTGTKLSSTGITYGGTSSIETVVGVTYGNEQQTYSVEDEDYLLTTTTAIIDTTTATTTTATTTTNTVNSNGVTFVTNTTKIEDTFVDTTSFDWGTAYTYSLGTGMALNNDGAAIVGTQKDYTLLTEANDNNGTRYKTYQQTGHNHSPLVDTVILLENGVEQNNELLLWTFKSGGNDANVSSTGFFDDFYESVDGKSHTIYDYSVFSTSSWRIPVVVESYGFANGIYKTVIDGTNESNLSPDVVTQSFDLGDVASSVSIAGTGTKTTRYTHFTHVDYVKGYSANSLFTTGTKIGFWATPTYSIFSRDAIYKPIVTTVTKSARVTAEYTTLVSSYTTTENSNGDTGRFYLGLVSSALQSVTSSEVTRSFTSYRAPNIVIQGVKTYSDNGDTFYRETQENAALVAHTNRRLVLRTAFHRPFIDLPACLSHEALPNGYVGFIGSFTQTVSQVYLSTTQGLAAGGTFAPATLYPPGTANLYEKFGSPGLTVIPINEDNPPNLVGVGLESSSLISTPTSVVSAVSVAATWTSTYLAFSPTLSQYVESTATKLATHTLGVAGPIAGKFYASEGAHAGHNRLGVDVTVRLPAYRASYTLHHAFESEGVPGGVVTNSEGNVTFVIPGHAAVSWKVEDAIKAWFTLPDYRWSHHPFYADSIYYTGPQ